MSRRTLKDILDRLDAGVSSGFPIVYDDGTFTFTISVSGHTLRATVVANAGSVLKSETLLYDGGFEVGALDGGGVFFEDHGGGGVFFDDFDGGGFFYNGDGGGGVFFNIDGATAPGFDGGFFVNDDGGGIFLTTENGGAIVLDAPFLDPDGGIFLRNLPTSDPGVADQLWNDSGTVKISL